MSNFIPLTGSTNIVDQIIQRFQGVPSFDFIEYTDAQKVTGQLFFELIGDPFEPYKNLETFAQIEADPTAIDLVNNSTNAQKVITGIVAEVVGFALDAPDIKAYAGNDGFILLAVTNQVSTPDASNLQYRVDGGAWVTVATLTNEIETSYVVLPELPNNQQFTIEARQSLFGTPSLIASRSVTTTPTVDNWNAFFNDVATRDYFYNDSYVDNNTYGALTSKTVMEMIFGSEGVVDVLTQNTNTLQILDLNGDNLTELFSHPASVAKFVERTNVIDFVTNTSTNTQDYYSAFVINADAMDNIVSSVDSFTIVETSAIARTTIETTATARDAVTGSNVAMPIVSASQDFLNVIEASANFRDSVVASQVAIDEFAGSQLALDTVIASENFITDYASSEIAMLSVANTPIYFEAFIASQTAMTAVDNVDLAVRILILEQTATQNYANFTNIADFIDDATAMDEVATSQDAMRALVASANALAEKVIEPIALNEVFDNEQATLIVANNEDAVTQVANSTVAVGVLDTYDLALRIMLLELTDQDYTQFANVQAVLDDETALNAIVASLPNLFIGLLSSVTDFANSESIMTIIVASETPMTALAASEAAMTIVANTPTAFNAVVASETAMTIIEQNDLALRILVLEQTNQDYTQFANFDAAVEAVVASQTDRNAIAASNLPDAIKYILLFDEHTFTNAGAEGAQGPTLAQIQSAYSNEFWASDTNILNMVTRGIQTWKVPRTGTYKIEAFGAGGVTAESGAIMRGDFTLQKDEIIRIAVGQRGLQDGSKFGGAGGTYVVSSPYNTENSILVIAGGGGGAAPNALGGSENTSGLTTPNDGGEGGVNGNGGQQGTRGGGGGGFFTNGQGRDFGFSFLNGSDGSPEGTNGGFGGGASAYSAGGGGGGGYSGGGGGSNSGGGGGGGSFNSGTNQSNSSSAHTEQGKVIITVL